jgi:hypothetical protein
MCPEALVHTNELDGEEAIRGRLGRSAADHVRQRPRGRRSTKCAKRSRSNEIAKRGMHQRRNKRAGWSN